MLKPFSTKAYLSLSTNYPHLLRNRIDTTITIKEPIATLSNYTDNASSFFLMTKIFKGAKFHDHAFRERWKKMFSDREISKSAQIHYYLEVKDKFYRLGKIIHPFVEYTNNRFSNNFTLVLQSPKSKNEIADFLRLGVAFSCRICFSCDEQEKETLVNLVNKGKQIIKGWNKTSIEIFDTVEEAIGDLHPIAFSLWTRKNEQDYIDHIKKIGEIENNKAKKVALVFGNEQEGLSLLARKLIHPNIFSLVFVLT